LCLDLAPPVAFLGGPSLSYDALLRVDVDFLRAEAAADRTDDASEAGIVGRWFTCWLKPPYWSLENDRRTTCLDFFGTGEPFEGVILPPELCVDDCERLFWSRGSGEPSPTGRRGERVFLVVGRSLEVDSRLYLRSSRFCGGGRLPSF
jgi:hypothetical protein